MLKKDMLYNWEELGLPSTVNFKSKITLEDVEYTLKNTNEYGLSFLFERDQIVSGGFLNKKQEDCLIVKNAEFPTGYFYFIFSIFNVGAGSTLKIYRSGISKNTAQQQKKQNRGLIAGALTQVDEQGLEAEYTYYNLVVQTIMNGFEIR